MCYDKGLSNHLFFFDSFSWEAAPSGAGAGFLQEVHSAPIK